MMGEEPMEELKIDVRLLKNAVFGDPANPRASPGLLHEVATAAKELHEIRVALQRGVWIVLTAVIGGVMAIVIKL
jgi:hypothetical protein